MKEQDLTEIPNPTTSDPTKHLRFVMQDGKAILQQMWEVKTFDARTIACIGLRGEWRDVPVEVEGDGE